MCINFKAILLALQAVPLLFGNIMAQIPEWGQSIPEGYINDYYVGSATASNHSDAFNLAVNNGLEKINIESDGVRVRSETKQIYEEVYTEEIGDDGTERSSTETLSEIENKIMTETDAVLPPGISVSDIYMNEIHGEFECWILLAKPKSNPRSPPSQFRYITSSVLVPGSGQMIKDQDGKALLFFSSTLLSLGGYLLSDYLQSDASTKAQESTRQLRRSYYNDRMKKMGTYKTISLISLSGFYVWNVFDAILDDPNYYVSVEKKGDNYWAMISYTYNF